MKKKQMFLFVIISLLLISLVFAFNFIPNIFNSKTGQLKVTPEHPFLINGKWIEAKDLKIGDELTNIYGKKIRIKSIKSVHVPEGVNVYNLEAGIYNDFILKDGIVVHNSNRLIWVPEIRAETRAKYANSEKRPLNEVYAMNDEERLAYAESRLYEFTPSQREAILYAHHTLETIAEKARYLKSKGLNEIERDIILSEGITGKDPLTSLKNSITENKPLDESTIRETLKDQLEMTPDETYTIINTRLSSESLDIIAELIRNPEEAHNIVNFERLLDSYRELDLLRHETYQPTITFYHASPKGIAEDFAKGLDASKSSRGFFFCQTPEEALKALEAMGYEPSQLNLIKIEVSKNIYNPTGNKPIIKPAATTESDAFFVPLSRYRKFNELMQKGLIKMSDY